MSAPQEPSHGRDLFALFDHLTRPLPRRLHVRPFPVVVVEPADGGTDEKRCMAWLQRCAAEMGLPSQYRVLNGDDGRDGGPPADPRARACSLLDQLAHPLAWGPDSPQFGRFRFPRSELITTLQEAVAAAREGGSGQPDLQAAAVAAWERRASLFPRRNGAVAIPGWGTTAVAVVVAAVGGAVSGFAEAPNMIALSLLGFCCALLLVVAALLTRGVWLPVVSRVGFGSRYRWLATSSFFRVLEDGNNGARGRAGFEGRLYKLFGYLLADDSGDFLLQTKTLAFLEDMRANYRKLSPDLRGFKRSAPPVLFLPGVTQENGGIDLLSALSDIRSRRSELHPLLVIASVDAGHRDEIPGPPCDPDLGSPVDRYEAWHAALGTSQAPSGHVPLPWLLRLPVHDRDGATRPSHELKPRRRPRWTWAWSWRGLVAGVVVVTLLAVFVQAELRSRYCSVSLTFGVNTDTRLFEHPGGQQECVGVATGGVRFEQDERSVGLDGRRRRPGTANTGSRLTLTDLQRRIDEENAEVEKSGKHYVTLLYVGAFTAARGEHDRTVSSVRELAGAYLAQLRNNRKDHIGQVGNPLKVRLLPVNAGQDMRLSGIAADRILDLARRDPTVSGVLGFSRNTEYSRRAIERLHRAGLPIFGTMNSSDRLVELQHFYSMAATNFEEAAAAKAAVQEQMNGKDRPERAMIVQRETGPSGDAYSPEIAGDAERALRPYHTDIVRYSGSEEIGEKVRTRCWQAGSNPYTLVYFAGRAEDLRGLMEGLRAGGCDRDKLAVVAGDDVSKYQFGTGPRQIALPPKVTFYHTAFAYMPNLVTAPRTMSNGFFQQVANSEILDLRIGGRLQGSEPPLVSGHMAMAFDATTALAQAAQDAFFELGLNRPNPERVSGGERVTSGAVRLALPRVKVSDAATGDIDLTQEPHARAKASNRGLTLVRITVQDGQVKSEPVCGRLSGGGPLAPGLEPCP